MRPYNPAVGPCIDVIIIHPETGEGRPVTGLLDTGSAISAVKTVVLNSHARLIGEGDVHGNHLQATTSKIYEAKLHLVLGDAPPIAFPVPEIVKLYEFHRPEHPNIDMLIGRNILRHGVLIVHGPRNEFEFRI